MFGTKLTGSVAPAQVAASPAPARSRWEGVKTREDRADLLAVGTYRTQIVAVKRGFNPAKNRHTIKVELLVKHASEDAQTPAGTVALVIMFETSAGMTEQLEFLTHSAGFGATLAQKREDPLLARDLEKEGKQAFYTYVNEHGDVMDASLGLPTPSAESVVGCAVDVEVRRGTDMIDPDTKGPTGDYFRNFTWGVAE